MAKKKGIIDEWHDAALDLADKLGIIDHDFTEEDLDPIKKALKAADEAATKRAEEAAVERESIRKND